MRDPSVVTPTKYTVRVTCHSDGVTPREAIATYRAARPWRHSGAFDKEVAIPSFRLRPFTKEDADVVAAWKYDGLYSFYDSDADADDLALMLDPRSWEDMYYAAEDERGGLVGFVQFTRDGDTVEIGLGLRPDLTGQGIGLSFLCAGLDFARARYDPRHFRLAVAAFNRRAITVYERAGFSPTRTFLHHTNGGTHAFVEMTRPALD